MTEVELFFKAITDGSDAEVEELLEKDARLAAQRNAAGVSAILFALYQGKRGAVDLMLKQNPDLDVFEASVLANIDKLRSLIEGNENLLNTYSTDGFTPLHLACFFGKVASAKYLVEAGADTNAISLNGADLRPINCAAASRDLDSASELVQLLLKGGADIKATQKGGYSALHSAAANGNVSLVTLLVKSGADQYAKADGKTPLDFARERDRTEVVAVLSPKVAEVSGPASIV